MFDFLTRKDQQSHEAKDAEDATFLKPESKKLRDKYQGWKFGVLTCTTSTCFVLLINICLALGALGQHGWGKDGQPVLWEGKCDTVSKMSTAFHLLINAMSTTLLCASSYCMQCLSSPTRQELDVAHKQRTWLDIGVLSPRNIKSISKGRKLRWIILALSTIPLHLFYNSVVFASIGSTSYWPLLIREPLLNPDSIVERFNTTDPAWPWSRNPTWTSPEEWAARPPLASISEAKRLRESYAAGKLERLENKDCLNAYDRQFQTRGSVLLITNNDTYPDLFLWDFGGPSPTENWMSPKGICDRIYSGIEETEDTKIEPSTWNICGKKVEYCLSEVPQERCKLRLSLPIAIIVVVFNAMKAICMLTMLIKVGKTTSAPPIMNIGDTVASFLDRSDPQTKLLSLTTVDDLRYARNLSHVWDTRPREVRSKPHFRFGAASRTRWGLTVILYSIILAGAIWLVQHAVEATTVETTADALTIMKSIGWGKVDQRTMIDSQTTDLITNAMIANSPQLILSWVYFSYNGLLTLLALAREWESYAQSRKGLRVSTVPQGKQRSTYFLQLPYRIAVPFMLISGFLHWLVSQSFFLVSVQLYSYDTATETWMMRPDDPASRVSIGYSLLPMIVGVVTGGSLLVGILAAGCTRFKTVMPVVSNCSVAISAACQPLEEDDSEAATSQVQWGVMGRLPRSFLHCGFSRRLVRQPMKGERYR